MTLDDLRSLPGFIYLGTPYSLYDLGLNCAAYDACWNAGWIIKRHGLKVFSPIAHSHFIATISNLDRLDHKLWMEQNEPFMDAASALIIVKLLGWDKSAGVAMEAEHFQRAGKPVVEMEPAE